MVPWGPAWALSRLAHALAPRDSVMTWRMYGVPAECGPVVSRCSCRIEGVAIAAAYCSSM